MQDNTALRFIAIVEAIKGVLSIVAAILAFSMLRDDVRQVAAAWMNQLRLNPAHEIPHAFLNFAESLSDSNIILLVTLALVYALVRFVEAYGLWLARRWAEWFAALAGVIYIPFELFEYLRKSNPVLLVVMAINIVIVLFMAKVLAKKEADASQ